jgi:hypothetical protein
LDAHGFAEVPGVHEFLRFQIADHQTGDTAEITKAP